MATGYGHSLVVTTAGRLYSFGSPRSHSALGHGHDPNQTLVPNQLTPWLVTALQGVRVLAVAAGIDHSPALSETGAVYSLGGCDIGGLGYGGGVVDTARN